MPLPDEFVLSKPDIQIVLRRIINVVNDSLLMLWQCFVYNFLVAIAKLFRAGVLVGAFERFITWFCSLFAGRLLWSLHSCSPSALSASVLQECTE